MDKLPIGWKIVEWNEVLTIKNGKNQKNVIDDNGNGLIDENEAKSYLTQMQKGMIPFDYSYWHIILFCIWMKTFNVELD